LVGEGANFTSRIHVEDLAALTEAALFSGLTGAYPVADLEPCPSREVAAFSARLFGLPLPSPIPGEQAHHTRRVDRKVDGRAIFGLLGVPLSYPSYRQGIPASLG
jgi:nucleoside-diphosphate-sugar epimerase